MNLILLFEADLEGGRATLRGARHVHLRTVLKSKAGDAVRVGLLDGPTGLGTLEATSESESTLRVVWDEDAAPAPPTDLWLAVPRPKSLRRVFLECTALGVARFLLFRSWRVEKSYLQADMLQPAHYRPVLHEGLMQARATREPRVVVEPLFRPFLEDRAKPESEGAVRLVLHPGAAASLGDQAPRITADTPVVLAIGPEGGFVGYELAAFEAAGFLPVSMGERVLRVETACVAALAQLDLLRRLRR